MQEVPVRVVYTYHEPRTFSDYMDLETGKTLYAVPGGTYDVAPASGRVVPGFPVPWFGFADDEARDAAQAAEDEAGRLAGKSAAGEGAEDSAPPPDDEASGTEEDQQF
jgi:hypothetical protein